MALFDYLKSTLLSKVVMAVTGVILVLFVIGHCVGNMQVFIGQETFNRYAHFLQGLGELLWIIRAVLIICLVLHIITSIRVKWLNFKAKGQKYEVKNYVKATLSGRTMMWTGILVVAFLVYHLLHFTIGVIDSENFSKNNMEYYKGELVIAEDKVLDDDGNIVGKKCNMTMEECKKMCSIHGKMTEEECKKMCSAHGKMTAEECKKMCSAHGNMTEEECKKMCSAHGKMTEEDCKKMCSAHGDMTEEECKKMCSDESCDGVIYSQGKHYKMDDDVVLFFRPDAYSMVVNSFRQPYLSISYIILVILVGFHLSHAIQSAFQTLGLNHPKYNGFLRALGTWLSTIIVICYISIPIAIWVGLVGGGV